MHTARALSLIPVALFSLSLLCAGCGPDGPDDTDAGQEGPNPLVDGAWQVAFDAEDFGAGMNAWGRSADDIYVVGGQIDQGNAMHFDGAVWTPLEVPEGPMLNWTTGTETLTWMVGEEGRVLRSEDGVTFVDEASGVDAALWGAWAESDDNVWAVGGDVRDRDSVPVITHWDGTSWAAVEVPVLDRPARALFKVWGTDAEHVWAVGSAGIVLFYDGASWAQQSVPGIGEDLISLWGTGPDDIIAVGGRSNGIIARFDGTAWEGEILAGIQGLNGVWVGPSGTAYVAGNRGTALIIAPGSSEYERINAETTDVLHGAWGPDERHIYMVGGSLLTNPPWTGTALVRVPADE